MQPKPTQKPTPAREISNPFKEQNADIIAGTAKDEFGKWDQSCLHMHLQNYTLDVWTGYYKSHVGMKEGLSEVLNLKE